jgi:hypothetical protein
LNLIGKTDVKGVLEDIPIYKKAIAGKATQLWQTQRRSTKSRETIKKFMGRQLKVPTETRWNSLYDAVRCLSNLHDNPTTRY